MSRAQIKTNLQQRTQRQEVVAWTHEERQLHVQESHVDHRPTFMTHYYLNRCYS